MAKFTLTYVRVVEQTYSITVDITKKEIVDQCGLHDEDAQDWRDHVYDYVSGIDIGEFLVEQGNPAGSGTLDEETEMEVNFDDIVERD